MSPPEPRDPEALAPMSHREILRALTGLLLSLLVAILSSTIVANALPSILKDLHGSQGQYTWVVTATLLAATATTPIWGKLADLFSKKLLYQVAIGLFAFGSILAGIATSMPELIAYRAVQGLGVGGLQALAQVVIAAMVSPRERGRYAGYTGAVIAVATVSGPLVGGFIVDTPWLGWRYCFFLVVPLALAAMVVIHKTLHLPVLRRKVRIDWLGATLIIGGVSLLMLWVSFAGKDFGWISPTSGLYLLGALLALGLAVFVESRAAEPVVPPRLFRDRTVLLSVLASLGIGTAMFGASVFIGQYFQQARGFSPTVAGLLGMPLALGYVLTSTWSGRRITKTGRWKIYLVTGAIALFAGLALLATITHTSPVWLLAGYLLIVGIGMGLTMQNLVLAVQNAVPATDLGAASSSVMFFRSLGGAAGVSVLGAVLAGRVGQLVGHGEPVRDAQGDASGLVFLIAAALALVALVAIALIKEVPLRNNTPGSTGEHTATPKPVDNPGEAVDNRATPVDRLLTPSRPISAVGGRFAQVVEGCRRTVDKAVDNPV
ncbi:MDR family MFS transporter [Crossiella sp. S99.2]|uniref:MDR family MFS transporter n=1 Tax=unclassified Crossiella TaxID=2620835 RepID=UPI0035AC1F5F